jgi:hypothetical protein
LGEPVARERRDGGQVKLSTFIPLKIRKRGASKVVVRPDGQVEAAGQGRHARRPAPAGGPDAGLLLAATARRRRGGSGSEIAQREGLHHSTVNELLRLTLLEPAIIQSILAGSSPSA